MSEKKPDEVLEKLAALEHQQWDSWSKHMVQKLKAVGLEKAASVLESHYSRLWIPYAELSEVDKEKDRKWARKAIAELSALGLETCLSCAARGDACEAHAINVAEPEQPEVEG